MQGTFLSGGAMNLQLRAAVPGAPLSQVLGCRGGICSLLFHGPCPSHFFRLIGPKKCNILGGV